MNKKNRLNLRLADDTAGILAAETERTGKTATAVVEDLLRFRRILSEDAQSVVDALALKHHLPPRKVVEVCVLKTAGLGTQLPFDYLAAA